MELETHRLKSGGRGHGHGGRAATGSAARAVRGVRCGRRRRITDYGLRISGLALAARSSHHLPPCLFILHLCVRSCYCNLPGGALRHCGRSDGNQRSQRSAIGGGRCGANRVARRASRVVGEGRGGRGVGRRANFGVCVILSPFGQPQPHQTPAKTSNQNQENREQIENTLRFKYYLVTVVVVLLSFRAGSYLRVYRLTTARRPPATRPCRSGRSR